jgi:hypothetical protein
VKEERFESKSKFKKWLMSATGVLLTSVALMGNVQDLQYQFTNPRVLASAMEQASEYFPEGEYFVTYTNSEDLSSDDLDYSKMAVAISLAAKMARSEVIVGGLQPLLEQLADFEYSYTLNRTDPAYITARIWVLEPTNPSELQNLKEIFHEYSVFYAFNDGSGFITLNNGRMGNGFHKTVKI